jgi:TonB family protein
MKYLPILCLLMVQNIFGQTIDCALLEKAQEDKSKLTLTMRMHTTVTSKYGIIETMTEMDTEKSIHAVTKIPKMGGMPENEMEMIMMKGISYTKQKDDNIWYSRVMPSKDSARMAESVKNFRKGAECKIVGTETIDGKVLTIIESSVVMEKISDKPTLIRSWFDLKDSVIKKSEMNQELKEGMRMVILSEYGIAVAPIEMPLNAVSESLKPKRQSPKRISGAYSDKSKINTGPIHEQNPDFKDGTRALFDFIKNNVVYPQAARDAKHEGTVYAKFFVETDGTITDITIARGIGSGCDEAAIDVIKKMSGKWNCALDGGKPVRSQYTLPIQFRLNNISVKD